MIRTVGFAVFPGREDVDRIQSMIQWSDKIVSDLLIKEAPADPFVDCEILVRDDAGRSFEGVRLDREFGTNRFTLVLLTAANAGGVAVGRSGQLNGEPGCGGSLQTCEISMQAIEKTCLKVEQC